MLIFCILVEKFAIIADAIMSRVQNGLIENAGATSHPFVCNSRDRQRRKERERWRRRGLIRKWVFARVHAQVLRTCRRASYLHVHVERGLVVAQHTTTAISLTPSLHPRGSINQRSNRMLCFRRDESCCRFPTWNRYIAGKGFISSYTNRIENGLVNRKHSDYYDNFLSLKLVVNLNGKISYILKRKDLNK